MEYVEPKFRLDGYNCPHCNAYAKQTWRNRVNAQQFTTGYYINEVILDGFYECSCERCNKIQLWIYSGKNETAKMIYPLKSSAPLASTDLPEDCVDDYNEARTIFNLSSKAAAALLRLVLQKLCIHLGEKGKNLNDDIGNLVKRGLPPDIQRVFDIVRVVGNNAVHPGEINIDDNPEIAYKLFMLINMVIEYMITRPKEINALYGELPSSVLEGIEKRDKK